MKKAILVVSFGTSYEDTLEANITACERRIAAKNPDSVVRRAFTSGMVMNILKQRGIHIDTAAQALQKLRDEKFDELVIQPLHILAGIEYHKIIAQLIPYTNVFASLRLGAPLMAKTSSYFTIAKAVIPSLPPLAQGEAVVFMGHGSEHPANAAYMLMQAVFDELGARVYMGTVEGYPALSNVVSKLKRDGIRSVVLIPFMLVAGDHARNDMASDEPDSWKSVLTHEGFAVRCVLRGLGEIAAVRDIYADNAARAESFSLMAQKGARHG